MRIYHLPGQAKSHFTVVNVTHLSSDFITSTEGNVSGFGRFTTVKWARVNVFIDLPRLPIYCGKYCTTVNVSRVNTALDGIKEQKWVKTIFLFSFIPGTLWMNWCMMGTCAFCIPLLLLFKERYTRMELDAANIQARGRGKQDQEPLLSSGGVQPADYLSTSASSIVWIAQMIQDAGLGVVPDMMQLLINGVNLLNHSEFLSFDSKLCLSVSPIFVARPKVYLPSKLRIFLSDVCNPCSIQANDYFLVSKIIPLSSLVIMYLLPCLHETHLPEVN